MSTIYQGTLAENLEFGHALEVCAKAQNDASWFNITLAAKSAEDNTTIEVGLQILLYIHNNMIAFKRANDGWREEYHHEFSNNIFLTEFKINIILADAQFFISINDRHCSRVDYGMPLHLLNTIKISGHLDYVKQVDHRRYYPNAWPLAQITEDYLNFSNEQPMSFKPGHVMVINAQLFGNDKGRFVVHFRNARDNQRQELHISVRFDSRIVARNSKIVSCRAKRTETEYLDFGDEENDGDFPFDDFSRPFKLAIAFTDTAFKLAKDGQFFCKYYFRTPNVLPDVGGVKIYGSNGVTVQVNGIDHIASSDPLCLSFEYYSGNNS